MTFFRVILNSIQNPRSLPPLDSGSGAGMTTRGWIPDQAWYDILYCHSELDSESMFPAHPGFRLGGRNDISGLGAGFPDRVEDKLGRNDNLGLNSSSD